MLLDKIKYMLRLTAIALGAMAAGGCDSMIYDDLDECPAGLQLRFVFDYNMLQADAFASQVKSVNVWAFDATGACVWSGAASGEVLTTPGYVMETPLGEGRYDFVAWCGLEGNADFDLATYRPTSRQELEVKLKMTETGGLNVSSSHFKSLFHGYKFDVDHIVDPMKPSVTTVTVPLVKDTNDIAVMLANEDGTALSSSDFTVTFSYADSYLAWDNAVMASSPEVTYRPWSTLYGETTLAPRAAGDDGAVRSTLLYELSTSRLMADGKAYLDVVRNTDGVRIIHVPLIEYFLLEKGARHEHFGNQEYLDRRDDYSALFFIDKDKNWYMAGAIYINSWAMVPPQSEEI